MTSYRRRRSAAPSNRLSHGLASRHAAEARRGDAEALAAALRGDAPADRDILETSMSLAEAILQLNAVRAARLSLLAEAKRDIDDDAATRGEQGEPDANAVPGVPGADERVAAELLAVNLAAHHAEFCRLDDYERKAASRRAGLMRRLDYLLIEIRRRA